MTRGSRKLSHPASLAGPAVEPQAAEPQAAIARAAEPQAAIARAAEPQAAEPRRFTFVMSGARGMQWSTLPRCQLCGRRMNSLHGNAVACSNLAFRTPLAARPLPHAPCRTLACHALLLAVLHNRLMPLPTSPRVQAPHFVRWFCGGMLNAGFNELDRQASNLAQRISRCSRHSRHSRYISSSYHQHDELQHSPLVSRFAPLVG